MCTHLLQKWRVLVFVLFLVSIVTPLSAQRHNEATPLRTVQPRVLVVFGEGSPAMTRATREAKELLETTIEGELRSSLRYVLARTRTTGNPETYVPDQPADAVVFARTTPRHDGSLRVELDVQREGRFVWSVESRLPLGRERFRVASELAKTLEEELAGTFPGFGRLSFRNTGFDHPYYVYADGGLIGTGIRTIELPVGTYELEIRRRDDDFEHVVGRRRVTLSDDEFLELRFQMERDPPPVPGFMRLTNPADRWDALFDIRGAVMIPMTGFGGFDGNGYGGFATALFNDVLFRGHVFGFEAAYINFRPNAIEEETDLDFEIEITSLMVTTGLSVGPVSRVDYVVRVGGGMALTASEVISGGSDSLDFEFESVGYSPVAAGSMEFGFGYGRNGRASLNISYYGVHEDEEWYTFIGLGLGLGGRF